MSIRWAAGLGWAALGLGWVLAGCSGGDGACESDGECPSGQYCRQDGACAFDCVLDADCPEGFRCDARGRCERGCRKTNGGVEACDGLDNDCDGATDEPWPELGQSCQNGDCPPGLWVCTADGTGAECDGRVPLADDAICDGVDDDCDGVTDEDAVERFCPLTEGVCAGASQSCVDGAWTQCDYGEGYTEGLDEVCDGLDSDCDGELDEDAPMAVRGEFGAEAGDGLDNNCNGLIDEPGGVMVPIDDDYAIDAYESTVFAAADCTGERYGHPDDDYPPGFPAQGDFSVELYACSLPDLYPSSHLSWYRARQACQAQGKRLCTADEYAKACIGPELFRYPYGGAFFSGRCNDGWNDEGEKSRSGEFAGCESGSGLFDMSGNLGEWVADGDPENPGNALQGGGYYTCRFCTPQGSCYWCDRQDDGDKDKIMIILDCQPGTQVVDQNWESFAKWTTEAYLGARCCMDL
jgi:hypothetical protein